MVSLGKRTCTEWGKWSRNALKRGQHLNWDFELKYEFTDCRPSGWMGRSNHWHGWRNKLVTCDLLVTASEVTAPSSLTAPWIPMTSAAPNFDLCLLYLVVPQGSAQIQLSAPQGGNFPQAKAGNHGAFLATFLRDCHLAPPTGQTVASYGLSSFVCNERENSSCTSYLIVAGIVPYVWNNPSPDVDAVYLPISHTSASIPSLSSSFPYSLRKLLS